MTQPLNLDDPDQLETANSKSPFVDQSWSIEIAVEGLSAAVPVDAVIRTDCDQAMAQNIADYVLREK